MHFRIRLCLIFFSFLQTILTNMLPCKFEILTYLRSRSQCDYLLENYIEFDCMGVLFQPTILCQPSIAKIHSSEALESYCGSPKVEGNIAYREHSGLNNRRCTSRRGYELDLKNWRFHSRKCCTTMMMMG